MGWEGVAWVHAAGDSVPSREYEHQEPKKISKPEKTCRLSASTHSSGTYADFTALSAMIPLFPLGSSRISVTGNVTAFTL